MRMSRRQSRISCRREGPLRAESARVMSQLLVRFLIGGTVVSLFAMLGDTVKPKSFAGIFGAAPSIALATLALTARADGPQYAALEARSMIIGAAALVAYAAVSSRALWKNVAPVPVITAAGLIGWLALALGGWLLLRVIL
jgi:hypothetical protein